MRLVVAIALFIGIPVCALAGDDPAVIVCEAAIKSLLKSPKSYERHSFEIRDSIVIISYDAVNAYNAPLRMIDKCHYKIDGEHFKLVSEVTQANSKRVSEITEVLIPLAKTEHEIASLRAEARRLTLSSLNEAIKEDTRERAAEKTGIYPIPSNDTRLSKN